MAGKTVKISGPLIIAEGMADAKLYDVVRVSDKGLIGEVIELRGDKASIQVYEETSGLGPGEDVFSTGEPLSAELAPGLLEGIFDGIQRPLNTLYFKYGERISRGVSVNNLNREKKWHFVPCVKVGDEVTILGKDGEEVLDADAFGAMCHSFSYEVLCNFSSRVTRVYKEEE